jgi:hypothetical protein
MTNGTLRVTVDVNNDSSGYAWPSAYQVAHFTVDGAETEYRVNYPDEYASNAYVEIPLSAGSHTLAMVQDYAATIDLESADPSGSFSISSGQTTYRGANFNDKDCHPSCP